MEVSINRRPKRELKKGGNILLLIPSRRMHNLAFETPQSINLWPGDVVQASSCHDKHITGILKFLIGVQLFDLDFPF